MSDTNKQTVHTPVLLKEVLEFLSIRKGETVGDMTLGGGGHAKELAMTLGKNGTFIGVDADSEALTKAGEALKKATCRIILEEENFRNIDTVCKKHAIKTIHKVLFDLGLSSDQIEASERGFSFHGDEPLLMTFRSKDFGPITAEEIVNEWSEETLTDILKGFGEERFAKKIAKEIVQAREEKRIKSTSDLIRVIERAIPARFRRGKTHFATKTFQAIRMAVNDELPSFQEGFEKVWKLLAVGGRIAVISFHSVEDRAVKQAFRKKVRNEEAQLITKKPVTSSKEELATNRRARSAKLRIIEKIT